MIGQYINHFTLGLCEFPDLYVYLKH